LLGAVVQQPDSGGVILTGRLSLIGQPWLADYAVAGVVLFPATGFVELAIRAGDEVGCGVLEELVLAAPLVLQDGAAVQVQVVVAAADVSGRRAVSVYSRGSQPDSEWTLNAEGMLAISAAEVSMSDMSTWPPADAVAVDIADAYQQLAARGYDYGPVFQGLRAMWRRGQELFAEVALPEGGGADIGGFGIHPALLDAALHAGAVSALDEDQTMLPFSWQGVSLQAAGAARVRVRITPAADDNAVSTELADTTGSPVLSVRSLTLRPVTREQLHVAVSGASARPSGRARRTSPRRQVG
jgi:polyketide synthase 7